MYLARKAHSGGSMPDEMLVRLAQENDDTALALLITRYMPVVRRRSSRFTYGAVEPEDLVQEGVIGFLSAIRRYRPGSAGFKTFAVLCIDRSMISAVRATLQKKQIPKSSLVSLNDDFSPVLTSPGDDPQNLMIANEDLHRLSRKIDESLTPLEREVLSYYLAGLSYGATAKRLGCSCKAVDNALQRVRRKLK